MSIDDLLSDAKYYEAYMNAQASIKRSLKSPNFSAFMDISNIIGKFLECNQFVFAGQLVESVLKHFASHPSKLNDDDLSSHLLELLDCLSLSSNTDISKVISPSLDNLHKNCPQQHRPSIAIRLACCHLSLNNPSSAQHVLVTELLESRDSAIVEDLLDALFDVYGRIANELSFTEMSFACARIILFFASKSLLYISKTFWQMLLDAGFISSQSIINFVGTVLELCDSTYPDKPTLFEALKTPFQGVLKQDEEISRYYQKIGQVW
ncbi:hypothetical protein GEMRC1_002980 [Eukaryota sp. GEM-RC1]